MSRLTVKPTAKCLILAKLGGSREPLAIHELGVLGYSENALATRMSELAYEGLVVGRERSGGVKEWRLTTPEEREAILETHKPKRRKPSLIGRLLGSPIEAAGQMVVVLAVPKWDGWPVRIEVESEAEVEND